MPKFSIIMPIEADNLKVEQYILGVLKQSYNDFELWLICDDSNEANADICYKYYKKDMRVKLIYPKHKIIKLTIKQLCHTIRGDLIMILNGLIHHKYLENFLEDLHELNLESIDKFSDLNFFSISGCLVFLGSTTYIQKPQKTTTKIINKIKKSLQNLLFFKFS